MFLVLVKVQKVPFQSKIQKKKCYIEVSQYEGGGEKMFRNGYVGMCENESAKN